MLLWLRQGSEGYWNHLKPKHLTQAQGRFELLLRSKHWNINVWLPINQSGKVMKITPNAVQKPWCTIQNNTCLSDANLRNFGTSCQSLAPPQAEIAMVYFWASNCLPSSCTTDFINATMLSPLPCWERCVRASSRLLPDWKMGWVHHVENLWKSNYVWIVLTQSISE